MRRSLLALCFLFPVAALAVDKEEPTAPTPTTAVCAGGRVWDHDAGACIDIGDGRLDDGTLYAAAREFARDGQYDHAAAALAAMQDRRSDRVLTYMGLTLPPSGRAAQGLGYYAEALAKNPDNLIARSYMGQGLAELGNVDGARTQLAEIRARGGAGSWPELALLGAIRTAAATAP
jgi:tetratricopeptide (TPR) repeat protein